MKRFHFAMLLSVTIPAIWWPVVAAKTAQGASLIWAPPSVARIIEEGMAQNKEIQSLEAQVEEFKELVPFAGALEDPRLGIAVLNLPTDTFRFDQEAMTQKQLFVSQKIPWFGKLSLRSQRGTLEASRQQALLEAKTLELARKIATTCYELGFVATSLRINERLTNMVTQMLRASETRYAAGMGLQHEVLQAQVESTKLLDEKIALERQRQSLEDRISELVNREHFAPVAAPEGLSYFDFMFDLEDLKAQSLQGNPWLRVRQAEVDQAAVDVKLAEKAYWPDMDFKLAYGQRDEDFTGRDLPDFVSTSVVINVPLWQKNRQDKKLAAAKKGHASAMKAYRGLVEALPYRVDALGGEIRNIQENYRLYADAMVLQADQWARSLQTAYEVGKVEFDTMIHAKIRVLRFELQAQRYLYTIYQKRAALEELLGSPLQTGSVGKR
jgi:cobalt-zinc-cadmium efflux system outer membrane protein